MYICIYLYMYIYIYIYINTFLAGGAGTHQAPQDPSSRVLSLPPSRSHPPPLHARKVHNQATQKMGFKLPWREAGPQNLGGHLTLQQAASCATVSSGYQAPPDPMVPTPSDAVSSSARCIHCNAIGELEPFDSPSFTNDSNARDRLRPAGPYAFIYRWLYRK